jgi:hypothetical protein
MTALPYCFCDPHSSASAGTVPVCLLTWFRLAPIGTGMPWTRFEWSLDVLPAGSCPSGTLSNRTNDKLQAHFRSLAPMDSP